MFDSNLTCHQSNTQNIKINAVTGAILKNHPKSWFGEDLSYICPLSQLKGFEPEYDLACDHCKYFGVVRFSGNNMKIVLNEKIAEISKE